MRLVCGLVLVLGGFQLTCAVIRVGAWNIQTFGQAKAARTTEMDHIAEVVRRYDVVVIQELRGSDDSAITALMSRLNGPPSTPRPPTAKKNTPVRNTVQIVPPVRKTIQKSPAVSVRNNEVYQKIVSGRLGATVQTERYLYIYKTTTVNYLGPQNSFQYPDPQRTFSRPPFAVKFQAKAAAGRPSFDFVMIPLHAKPSSGKTVAEINALADVVNTLPRAWNTQNILLLGDFNAGGRYLPKKHLPVITLTAPDYHWLICGGVATTVGNSQCPYDRIVAYRSMMQNHVVANTAQAFNFGADLGLTQPQALDVSDHFPVEVELE